MNLANRLLALLAMLQVGLVSLVFWLSAKPAMPASEALISLDIAAISSLKLSDDTGQSLNLRKDNSSWVIVEADDYPVNSFAISSFLNSLSNLKSQNLIARNASSYDRLRLGDTSFVRKLELATATGQKETLFVGSSPRANSVHIRSTSSPNVYLSNDLHSSDINLNKSAWVDTSYLNFNADEVVQLDISNANGNFSFSKDAGNWRMEAQPDATLNDAFITSLVRNLANLRMLEPLNLATNKTHATDSPQASIRLITRTEINQENAETNTGSEGTEPDPENLPASFSESTYQLSIGEEVENGLAVKASTSDYVVSVSTFLLDDLLDSHLESFLLSAEN